MSKEVTTLSPAMVEVQGQLMDLLASIPEAGGDGANMLLDLLNAGSVSDLIDATNTSQSLPDIEAYFDKDIKVTDLAKALTDYQGDEQIVPWYLVVTFLDGKDEVTATTSAAQVMVVLLKLYAANALPAVVRLSYSAKLTRAGRKPVNIAVKSASSPINA